MITAMRCSVQVLWIYTFFILIFIPGVSVCLISLFLYNSLSYLLLFSSSIYVSVFLFCCRVSSLALLLYYWHWWYYRYWLRGCFVLIHGNLSEWRTVSFSTLPAPPWFTESSFPHQHLAILLPLPVPTSCEIWSTFSTLSLMRYTSLRFKYIP